MKFKLKYFAIHLALSAMIMTMVWMLVFMYWYPAPLARALGVNQMMMILLAIDIVLGPFLTLLLVREGKKGLKFDLFVIAIVQLSALMYGLYSVEKGRPIWMAFDLNRFELVQAFMLTDTEKVEKAYQTVNWSGPKWVAVRPPKDKQEESDWLFYELEKGVSPGMRPALYQPVEMGMSRIIAASLPLSQLEQFNTTKKVHVVLSAYPDATGFLPMRTSDVDMSVLVDSKQQLILGVVDLRPW